MPTLYSLGKAKIVGIALASGVAGVKSRRSEVNIAGVTGLVAKYEEFRRQGITIKFSTKWQWASNGGLREK